MWSITRLGNLISRTTWASAASGLANTKGSLPISAIGCRQLEMPDAVSYPIFPKGSIRARGEPPICWPLIGHATAVQKDDGHTHAARHTLSVCLCYVNPLRPCGFTRHVEACCIVCIKLLVSLHQTFCNASRAPNLMFCTSRPKKPPPNGAHTNYARHHRRSKGVTQG